MAMVARELGALRADVVLLHPRDLPDVQRVHDALVGFTEVAPGSTGCRVANRLSAMASNGSKPYRGQEVV
jgi:hypothetical protein